MQDTPLQEKKPGRVSRLHSFKYALEGLRFLLRTQPNAQIHAAISISAVGAGWFFGITAADWRWLLVMMLWVWFAEAMNTAFEYLCDIVSPEFNVSVKRAKDIAAGAVLLTAIVAFILGILIFWPYVASLMRRG